MTTLKYSVERYYSGYDLTMSSFPHRDYLRGEDVDFLDILYKSKEAERRRIRKGLDWIIAHIVYLRKQNRSDIS